MFGYFSASEKCADKSTSCQRFADNGLCQTEDKRWFCPTTCQCCTTAQPCGKSTKKYTKFTIYIYLILQLIRRLIFGVSHSVETYFFLNT